MKQEHPIFKAIVMVEDQSDCDRGREICERYELPMWKDVKEAFRYIYYDEDNPTYLQHYEQYSDENRIGFFVDKIEGGEDETLNIVTMKEFEALCEDYNPQYKNMEDILSTLKELNNLLNS